MQHRLLLALFFSCCQLAAPSSPEDPIPTPRHADAPATPSVVGAGAQRVSIPLRDGVELTADLYLPSTDGRHPVLIEVTPYGRRGIYSSGDEHGFWNREGFALLVVDARGTGESGGTLGFMTDARTDGPQIVEWAATREWSSGKVGMRGSSYSGTYPLQTAAQAPEGLACISPNATFHDAFSSPPYPGGALMQQWALSWTALVDRTLAGKTSRVDPDRVLGYRPLREADVAVHGVEVPVYRQLLAHPSDDDFWAKAHLSEADYRRIRVPALAFTGWYDTTLPGSIANYRAMRALAASASEQWLVLGPWDHATAQDGGYSREDGQPVRQIGVLPIEPSGFKPGQRMALEFFTWCMKDGPRPDWPAVQIFAPGQDRWLTADRLPVPGTRTRTLYLAHTGAANAPESRGLLVDSPDEPGEDRYVHDPANPVRADVAVDGRTMLRFGPQVVSAQLDRPDVLRYVTSALEEPLSLLGEATLELHIVSDAPDTDFVALLEDLAPDGRAVRLGSGWAGTLRTRYREGAEKLVLLKPGEATTLRLDLFPHGHTLRAGHRLRLSVMSSAYPFISVNPNTGGDIATDTAPPRRAHQTVLHGEGHPSALRLEVL
jgi:hypothetical protein